MFCAVSVIGLLPVDAAHKSKELKLKLLLLLVVAVAVIAKFLIPYHILYLLHNPVFNCL
jgi:predicted histidine transporter YuiF (NhaC family)